MQEICIQLINQTSDFHEIFSVNSEDVILCRNGLILYQWGHSFRVLKLVHELFGQTSYVHCPNAECFERGFEDGEN